MTELDKITLLIEESRQGDQAAFEKLIQCHRARLETSIQPALERLRERGIDSDEVFQEKTPVTFRRGDANADGTVNLADGVATLGFLFAGDQAPPCLDAADIDDSGELDIADSIGTFNWLFAGGEAPAPPGFQQCGVDPTDDDLGCANPPDCQ